MVVARKYRSTAQGDEELKEQEKTDEFFPNIGNFPICKTLGKGK